MLKRFGLAPQTFAAVYDGHGGESASAFLAKNLHVNIAADLDTTFSTLLEKGVNPKRMR